ncbi:MAG: hypothetical protein EOO04_21245 [Chitinophagaceae bacterium]|nr:MAG: hypothetical protein EOO04_21245 [Chitinophagaceae bacterium]
MKLKPAGILVVVVIIAVLAYLAFKPKTAGPGDAEGTEYTTTTPGRDKAAAPDSPKTVPAEAKSDAREFNYVPEKPVNGTLKGVVEVGATGFNSFVINMDDQKRWEIVSKDFGESLTYEGLATTEDIRSGLRKYLSKMFDKGVSKNNMHFVISSGAQKEPKTKTISDELKKTGYVVNNVTPQQEAIFAFRATVPPPFADNSFMIDIGSGNTKVSWEEDGRLKPLELPGAKYFEKSVSDETVYNEVKSKVTSIPENKRNVGFIIGGVPFMMAKQHRKGEERYTVLKAASDYKAADKRMGSGLNIYKAVVETTKTDTFVFDWDANFTIGFLLSLNK